jgi:8-oxo-dGTP pyrophosphatase MutT (NUDIX family)
MDRDIVQIVELCSPDLTAVDCSADVVGALFLFRKNDHALLLQLRDEKPNLRHAGLWVPPGGHIEHEETIEECTLREFYEETNYHCKNINWFYALNIEHPQWPTYLLGISWAFYDDNQTIKCQEGQALKFIKRNETDSLPIPNFLFTIWDKLLKEF